jgi:glycosyltransferase involved in cell wall biosynthesis
MPVSADAGASGRGAHGGPDLSIVVPARDEAGNIAPLVAEVAHVMSKTGLDYELLLVDDGSRDTTAEEIRVEAAARPWVRGITLPPGPAGRGHGQSAALLAGLQAARGAVLVTLDADLQNDPADVPRLLEMLRRERADMVQGDRTASRRDGLSKRVASVVGRVARRLVLGDTIRDTGCTLRVFRPEVLEALPLQFRGMHRFVPYCARLAGHRVVETPVAHRPRAQGRSKYGLADRAGPGLRDLLAVRWMRARLARPRTSRGPERRG